MEMMPSPIPTAPIAVVIPVYNRAHTLSRTLQSIVAQTRLPSEIIIVDNNSTDDSAKVMSEWADSFALIHPEVTVKLLSETTPGACAARNRGLAHVTAAYTMFFDSDDEMHPTHISDFAAAAEMSPDATLFGRDIILVTLNGTLRRRHFILGKKTEHTLFHHLFRGSFSTQRIMAATELFRRVGGWNEGLEGWNDYELGVRLILSQPVVVKVAGEPSVTVWQQAESITGTTFSSRPERWEMSLDAVRTLVTSSEMPPEAVDWVDARAIILAAQYASESEGRLPAGQLREKVLSDTRYPHRLKAIYTFQRLFGRMAWVLARILL